MTYSLGLDGGGTKTECVVLDANGQVAGQGVAGPSNPLRVGFATAAGALTLAARAALTSASAQMTQVTAVCAGLAGAGRPSVANRVLAFLAAEFPQAFVHATTDLEIALEAAVGGGPGVVLIAGTGSSAYGRNAEGNTARAGGCGPWLGDEGSAFDVGRRALAAAALARDEGEPPTRLAERIFAALACSDWDDLTERIARNTDEVFPAIFPVVIEAAEAGDRVARDILLDAATALASLADIVIRRLGLADGEFALATSGGALGRTALLDWPLERSLLHFAPRARIGPLRVSPAIGAARLAKRLAESRAASDSRSTPAHGTED